MLSQSIFFCMARMTFSSSSTISTVYKLIVSLSCTQIFYSFSPASEVLSHFLYAGALFRLLYQKYLLSTLFQRMNVITTHRTVCTSAAIG